MALPSTLFSLLLSLSLVFANLLHDDRSTKMPKKGDPGEGWKGRIQDRQRRSVRIQASNMSKVLDFSADNDQEPDSNGEYTGASLKADFLPESFTICSAIMVDAWTTVFTSAEMFILLNVNGDQWGYVSLYAATEYTEQGGTSCG